MPSPEVWRAAARLSETLHARLGRQPQAEPDEATLARPLHLAVAAVAARAPDAIAATDGTVSVTYAELWQRAQSWAAHIKAAGPPPGPLALLLPADLFYSAGLLGCLMAGYPCLPLDPASPPGRIATILTAAKLDTIVTAGPLTAIPEGMRRIELGAPTVDIACTPAAPGPDDPAFLLPTSGSSGVPKLIVVTQRTMTHRALARVTAAALGRGDRYYFGPGAVISIADLTHMLVVLLAGATMHLLDINRLGIRGFLNRVRQEEITILRCGASLMRTLLVSPGAPAALASLRMLRLTGEQLLKSDVVRLRRVLPAGCAVVTGYSATEMAGHFAWVARDDDDTDPARVPAAGLESLRDLVVLNEAGAICAPGELGEIVVRSRYNALGEWIDGRCVPGRLIPDPDDPTQRVYVSGDMGYRGETGALIVVGRTDRQVKINGRRIDPVEVEETLRRLTGVRDAVVLTRPGDDPPVLLAFVTGALSPDSGPALRSALRGLLPPALVPARIQVLDHVPRLPNGKVDGVALLADVTDR